MKSLKVSESLPKLEVLDVHAPLNRFTVYGLIAAIVFAVVSLLPGLPWSGNDLASVIFSAGIFSAMLCFLFGALWGFKRINRNAQNLVVWAQGRYELQLKLDAAKLLLRNERYQRNATVQCDGLLLKLNRVEDDWELLKASKG